MMIYTLAELEMRAEARPGTRAQLARARDVMDDHPNAIFLEVSPGRRFGRAAERRGMCQKIGSTNMCAALKWTRPYQLWASWAPRDLITRADVTHENGLWDWIITISGVDCVGGINAATEAAARESLDKHLTQITMEGLRCR